MGESGQSSKDQNANRNGDGRVQAQEGSVKDKDSTAVGLKITCAML